MVGIGIRIAGLLVGIRCRERQIGSTETFELLLSLMEFHHPALQLWMGVSDGNPFIAV